MIELRWTDAVEMTDGGFMATLCLLASEVERIRAPRILIDAVRFKHEFGPGVMEWRDAAVIPRYGAAGVERFAFVMPKGFPHIGKESMESPAVFTTAWFGSRDDAFRWLEQGRA